MKLSILGCHSATPRFNAAPTAQVLEVRGHIFLIDCGEGTQMRLRACKVKFARIKHIFISHLHGDHFFGLIGLISTFRLLGREADLHIYGPKGIKEAIVLQLKLGDSWTNYPLRFHELDTKEPQLLFRDDKISVTTIPLNHRIYTNGFLFEETIGQRKLDMDAVKKYRIDTSYFRKIKQGADLILADGTRLANELLTNDPDPPKRYAYCSDTGYFPEMVPQIHGVDALYHESTFLEQHLELAERTAHSTARQAGQIAAQAEVKKLILGHYSGRYSELEAFRAEAQIYFPVVELAEDDAVFEL